MILLLCTDVLRSSAESGVCSSDLRQYFRALMVTLLTRMQTSKTDKYVYHFVYFLAFTMAIPVEGLGPDFVISSVEQIQPQYAVFLFMH